MRLARKIVKNSAYHVCARANRQELILEDNQFKLMFLQVLKQAKKKHKFNLRNFCIMGNHVHLDIEPLEDECLSRIMQWILSVFAIRYNKIFNYKGHVWYDRFKSRVIESFQQLVNTFLYIANNPVRAELVTHPLHFKYNGVFFHKNKDHPHNILDQLDPALEKIMNEFLEIYSKKNCPGSDCSVSFLPKKPGRKSNNRQ